MHWLNIKNRVRIWCMITLLINIYSPLWAASDDLAELSMEELLDIKVTSVGKKDQKLSDSAAAIFVITNEDIKHSGVTSIPDALRMVPGLTVSRIDSNKWAINSRETNSRFANKLLVLIDGRSVYTSTFSGVYWEVQDTLLEDVERIEVIRGPGATLWGANAVNGVINIITKHSADTQDGFVELGGGDHEKGFTGVRYGYSLDNGSYGRVYAKYFKRDEFEHVAGGNAGDDWDIMRGGFRTDSNLSPDSTLTLQGDVYSGEIKQDLLIESLTPPYFNSVADVTEVSGANLIGRWHRFLSSTSEFTLQSYYDQTKRQEAFLSEKRDTFDLEAQHRWRGINRHDILWGGRYRYTKDDFTDSYIVALAPDSRRDELLSIFIQDEVTLIEGKLWFTIGSKLEHNDYTGYEVQPSSRLLWSPRPNHKIWMAVSKAVRTPSRLEHDGRIVTTVIPPSPPSQPLPIEVPFLTNNNFNSEVLLAYELGYRFRMDNKLSLDIATFYNDYDDIRSTVEDPFIFQGTYIEQPTRFNNAATMQTYGAELATVYNVADSVTIDLAYSYLNSDTDNLALIVEGPAHQVSLRSGFKATSTIDIDLWLRYVDRTQTVHTVSTGSIYKIDGYLTGDLRLAWKPTNKLELSIIGQNLLEEQHTEFVQEKFTQPTKVPRSIYGKLTYRFN